MSNIKALPILKKSNAEDSRQATIDSLLRHIKTWSDSGYFSCQLPEGAGNHYWEEEATICKEVMENLGYTAEIIVDKPLFRNPKYYVEVSW